MLLNNYEPRSYDIGPATADAPCHHGEPKRGWLIHEFKTTIANDFIDALSDFVDNLKDGDSDARKKQRDEEYAARFKQDMIKKPGAVAQISERLIEGARVGIAPWSAYHVGGVFGPEPDEESSLTF